MVHKMGTVYAFLALVAISTIANVSAARYDLARPSLFRASGHEAALAARYAVAAARDRVHVRAASGTGPPACLLWH